jgi:aminopeptidase N
MTPYPYPKCDLVFIPAFPDLAYSVPGLVVVQAQVLKSQQANSGLYTAMVIAHELAHAWIGGLVTMRCREDSWLEEALTTYISRTALAEILPGTTPWAASTSATLPDDGYAQDAGTIRKLEALVGRDAIIEGLGTLLRCHAYGTATKDDLVRSWSAAARQDLRDWAAETLIPAVPARYRVGLSEVGPNRV